MLPSNSNISWCYQTVWDFFSLSLFQSVWGLGQQKVLGFNLINIMAKTEIYKYNSLTSGFASSSKQTCNI